MLLQYPTGHLLYQATLPSLGHIVALPNTQKHTQGGCQNEEKKKQGPNERKIKTPEKEQNEMEISNLSDAEFKTQVTKMFKGLSENLSSVKRPSEK